MKKKTQPWFRQIFSYNFTFAILSHFPAPIWSMFLVDLAKIVEFKLYTKIPLPPCSFQPHVSNRFRQNKQALFHLKLKDGRQFATDLPDTCMRIAAEKRRLLSSDELRRISPVLALTNNKSAVLPDKNLKFNTFVLSSIPTDVTG